MIENIMRCFIVIILIVLSCMAGISSALQTMERCKANKACGKGHCCAYRLRNRENALGFCMPNKKLGELCSTSYTKGNSFSCGCEPGLACALVERDIITEKEKYRCVQIPPEWIEHLENNTNTTQHHKTTSLLTVDELKRLLKILKAKPKPKVTGR